MVICNYHPVFLSIVSDLVIYKLWEELDVFFMTLNVLVSPRVIPWLIFIVISRKVIATLDQTRKDARKMKENIKGVSKEFEEAKEKTSTLMTTLTQRATTLEKLKAKVGIATALSAFLQLNELSDEEEEDEDLLKEGERCSVCSLENFYNR